MTTFRQFLNYAETCGCTWKSGYGQDENGMYVYTVIEPKKGAAGVDVFIDQLKHTDTVEQLTMLSWKRKLCIWQ